MEFQAIIDQNRSVPNLLKSRHLCGKITPSQSYCHSEFFFKITVIAAEKEVCCQICVMPVCSNKDSVLIASCS